MQDSSRATVGATVNTLLTAYTLSLNDRALVTTALKKLLEFFIMNEAMVNDLHAGKYPHWRFIAAVPAGSVGAFSARYQITNEDASDDIGIGT